MRVRKAGLLTLAVSDGTMLRVPRRPLITATGQSVAVKLLSGPSR
jgi:hypothetical protein